MAAFGVTLSLTEKTPQQIIAYLEKMQQLQVSSVFSSLQIPGDDPGTLQDTLAPGRPVIPAAGAGICGGRLPPYFPQFYAGTAPQLGRDLPTHRQRHGTAGDCRNLHDFRIVLNASTLNDPFLDALQQHGFHGELEAWHNYYPRRNTGLDVRFFEARNNWLKAHGVRSAPSLPETVSCVAPYSRACLRWSDTGRCRPSRLIWSCRTAMASIISCWVILTWQSRTLPS